MSEDESKIQQNPPTRMARFATSLKELGEIQVAEFDFMELLNRDVRDLEISQSLKRLGNVRVMEWDFRTVLPAVNKLAHQEVNFPDLLRRSARQKIMELDFKKSAPLASDTVSGDLQPLKLQLKNFLQYVASNLIDEPEHARIIVSEIAPGVLRFRLVLVKRDVAMIIGRGGETAAAIRGMLKAAAAAKHVHALLVIHSHEEEAAMKEP